MPSLGALGVAVVVALAPLAVPPAGSCEIRDVEISWGFKESFRSYISGAIALGQWSTSGDIGYQTPAFSFSGGQGYVMPDRSSAEVAFEGELIFEGHGGVLRTSLANPRLEIQGPRQAVLYVDVTGDTMDLVSVQATDVEFVTLRWTRAQESVDPASGLWEIAGVRATLTQAGSDAFGTYLAGEVFDPMDISLEVAPSCLSAPALNPWWIAGAVVGLAGLGALGLVLSRRGSKSPEPGRQ
jgi:hypothetical protein